MLSRITLFSGFLLLAGAGMAFAQGEVVQGRSRDLGMEFSLAGGRNWCEPTVDVHLVARRAATFNLNGKPFLIALGRIRAIIQDACPRVERITFDGAVKKRLVFAAEILRLTGWGRYIALNPATREPYCPSGLKPGPECDKRLAAYALAKRVMRGEAFSGTELTRVLDGPDDNYLMWRSLGLIGNLRVEPAEEFPEITASAPFADAAITNIAQACVAAGGRVEGYAAVEHNETLAQRNVACVRNGEPTEQNAILVLREKGRFSVFSLLSEGPPDTASNAAATLADAIRQVGQFAPKPPRSAAPPAAVTPVPPNVINPVLRPGKDDPKRAPLPRKMDPLPKDRHT